MTTDNQKSHLGVAALYIHVNQPYWPRVHGSRQRAFVLDPLYVRSKVEFTVNQDLIKVNHDYIPDPLLNG
jgi:hypothetical protein